jgi:peptide/nickel transport system substrate-binding protein
MARPAVPSRRVWAALAVAAAIGAMTFLVWWSTAPNPPVPDGAVGPEDSAQLTDFGSPRGGSLTASIRAAPSTFNRYMADGETHDAIAVLMQATLVRVNRSTDRLEPWLAESWTASDDNLVYTIKLRPKILWSDGAAFTAADVVFAFRAIYDKQSLASIGQLLHVAGKPLAVRAIDPLTVEVRFPAPFAPGLRLLDHLPVLPRHKLEPALDDGSFASAWSTATPTSDLAGLGPFVLVTEAPGASQTLVFSRNPRYWRTSPKGAVFPYLDRLALEVIPDRRVELARIMAGQLDFTQGGILPEDGEAFAQAERDRALRLFDLGPSIDADALQFSPSLSTSARKPWLASEKFRLAISTALDRRAYCDEIFAGACDPIAGPVTPGNTSWFDPELPVVRPDLLRSRAILAELGLQDRNGDGTLDDEAGRPVQFALLVRGDVTTAGRAAAFLRQALQPIGVRVEIAPLDAATFRTRRLKGDYEAIYDRVEMRDTDPAMNLDFWSSLGQPRIDALMMKQAATTDRVGRVALFADIQRLFAEQMPAIYLGVPYMRVATSSRVLNATPSRLRPHLLWNAEALATVPR